MVQLGEGGVAKTNANVLTIGILLKLSPISWFENERMFTLQEIMLFQHVKKRKDKKSGKPFSTSLPDFLHSSVAYATRDFGLRNTWWLVSDGKICSRCAVATAALTTRSETPFYQKLPSFRCAIEMLLWTGARKFSGPEHPWRWSTITWPLSDEPYCTAIGKKK